MTENEFFEKVRIAAGIITDDSDVTNQLKIKTIAVMHYINHGGGNIGSTYFTFRVISMNSKPESWWKKAIPPNDVVGALARATEKEVNDLLQAGLETDLDI